MKLCNECNIEVGGNFEKCPLCGSSLTGTPTKRYWPERNSLKVKSKFFRLQLSIVILISVIFFIMDLIYGYTPYLLFGLFCLMWVVIGEITLYQFIKRNRTVPGIILTCSMSFLAGFVLSTLWFPQVVALIPIPLICAIGVNFIFAIAMKTGPVMLNFIVFIIMGIVSWIFIIVLMNFDLNVFWNICFIESIGVLIATILIRGNDLKEEFQKRFIV